MKRAAVHIFRISIFLATAGAANAQTSGKSIPVKIDTGGKYLFYLHGAAVTELGDNGVNQAFPQWGPYEYSNILDSMAKQGFHVISEIRKKELDDSVYVQKISRQIDTILRAGVRPERLLVVGASSGSAITLNLAAVLRKREIKYVIMGACWPNTYKDYLHSELYGHFLSIIEATDPHGTCAMIFKKRSHVSSYTEIVLHTGLNHGFIYQGRKEWIDPIVKWFNH